MKNPMIRNRLLLLSVLVISAALVANAQPDRRFANNPSIVTIMVIGNQDLRLSVDATDYSPVNAVDVSNKTTITYNNLEMGQHILLVTRTSQYNSTSERISMTFNLLP